MSGYRLVSTPSLQWRFQIVRPDGLPEFGLTLFANDLVKSLSESSVPIYMREILALANWALVDSTVLNCRGGIYSALPKECATFCASISPSLPTASSSTRADLAGLKVTYVNATAGTRINVRMLLSALKRLYEFLITRGLYSHRESDDS